MAAGDVIALPQLPCEVALRAQRAWHSFIKNGFLFHTDRVLTDWVRDELTMHEFEECVRGVCQGVRGFSGSGLIPLLRPLSALPAADRKRLARSLDRAFEEDFAPDELAERIGHHLDALLDAMSEIGMQAAGSVEEQDTLTRIRERARYLWRELEKLPQGFWLPRRSLTGAEAMTA